MMSRQKRRAALRMRTAAVAMKRRRKCLSLKCWRQWMNEKLKR